MGLCRGWSKSGQYDMTPDHCPLLGETEVAGLWTNCGYSGHGSWPAPQVVGTSLISSLPGEHNPFRPDRLRDPVH